MTYLISAITLGLLGSFHCLGMCGPIAFALPVQQRSLAGRLAGNLLYQFGRVGGYAFIGMLFGLLGKAFELAGVQQRLSLFAGVVMLSAVIFPKLVKGSNRFGAPFYKAIGALKQLLGSFLQKKNFFALFTVGFLNAFLPCGMVYFALVGALAGESVGESMMYMALFGLGTLPMMITTMFAKNLLSFSFRNKLQKAVPYVLALMGIMFVLRGLGLGIPYISPTNGALTIDSTIPCH